MYLPLVLICSGYVCNLSSKNSVVLGLEFDGFGGLDDHHRANTFLVSQR